MLDSAEAWYILLPVREAHTSSVAVQQCAARCTATPCVVGTLGSVVARTRMPVGYIVTVVKRHGAEVKKTLMRIPVVSEAREPLQQEQHRMATFAGQTQAKGSGCTHVCRMGQLGHGSDRSGTHLAARTLQVRSDLIHVCAVVIVLHGRSPASAGQPSDVRP